VKELRTDRMRLMLSRGVRRSKRQRAPADGTLVSLVHERLPNGWHYQVEWIRDERARPAPWIIAYAWRPPQCGGMRIADYYLEAKP